MSPPHHGYHGRMGNAGSGECRPAIPSTSGRDADIVQLSRAQFDHRLTEFALEGAHWDSIAAVPQGAASLAQGARGVRRTATRKTMCTADSSPALRRLPQLRELERGAVRS